MLAIEVPDLVKRYDGAGSNAVDGISFDVPRGPNKSTQGSTPRRFYDRAPLRIKEMPEVGHGAHALGVA